MVDQYHLFGYTKPKKDNVVVDEEEAATNEKVKPPFPIVPIFNVTVIILAFLAYRDEIIQLLHLLSTKSRTYYRSHKDVVKEFLIPWNPQITSKLEFGKARMEWVHTYPSND